jgi:hypothetical protein
MQREPLDGNNRFVMWSSDGWLVYQSDRERDAGIWRSPRGGSPERLTRAGAGESHVPESWNAKANVLLFSITKGGIQPRWNSKGPELFYIAADDRLMAVPIRMSSTARRSSPARRSDCSRRTWAPRWR